MCDHILRDLEVILAVETAKEYAASPNDELWEVAFEVWSKLHRRYNGRLGTDDNTVFAVLENLAIVSHLEGEPQYYYWLQCAVIHACQRSYTQTINVDRCADWWEVEASDIQAAIAELENKGFEFSSSADGNENTLKGM